MNETVGPGEADTPRRHFGNRHGRSEAAREAVLHAADDAGAVFRALIGQSQHDGQLADDFRGRYLREQQARDQIPIARAVARGELPAGVDVAHVAEQLVAPLYYRVIVTGETVDDAFVDRIVEDFLRHRE
ncbi:TetR-like C-terminal domain-containing protein [Mycobacteroides abscessus]|nr:TetR-like C-terminal domain-containing protein [Mycobacteroides abscessus]